MRQHTRTFFDRFLLQKTTKEIYQMSTLKDVAKECGLSVTTVSRALNNRGYISSEAHEKIQAAMKKLNYQPNEIARSLSKQSSKSIGVIMPYIDQPFFSEAY